MTEQTISVAVLERRLDDCRTPAALVALAAGYANKGRHAEASALLEERLRGCLGDEQDNDEAFFQARDKLAACYDALGRRAEALAISKENFARCREALGDDSERTVAAKYKLAGLHCRRNEGIAEALELYEECLETSMQTSTSKGVLSRFDGYSSYECMLSLAALYVHKDRRVEDDSQVRLSRIYELARHLRSWGGNYKTREVEALLKACLAGRQRVLGLDHPWTVATSVVLAMFSYRNGYVKRDLYETLIVDGLARSESAECRWEDHPDALGAFLGRGRSVLSHDCYELRVAACRVTLLRRLRGPHHVDTLESLKDLARLHEHNRDYAEAVSVWRESLEVEKVWAAGLSPEDAAKFDGVESGVMYSICHLAGLCESQGRLADAVKLYEEGLSRRPPPPPLLLCRAGSSQSDGASQPVAEKLEKHVEETAEEEEERQEEREEENDEDKVKRCQEEDAERSRHRGDECLHKLVQLYPRLEGDQRAEKEGNSAVDSIHSAYAFDAVDAERADRMFQLAEEFMSMGPYPYWLYGRHPISDAVGLLGACLSARQRLLGPHDASCEAARVKLLGLQAQLGALRVEEGRCQEAAQLLEEALPCLRETLGPDHPDTLAAQHKLSVSFWRLKRSSEALTLSQGCMQSRRAVLGCDHKDTLESMGLVALLYEDLGRPEEALVLSEDTLERTRRTQGNDAIDTLHTMLNLSQLHKAQGRSAEAIALLEPALTGLRLTHGSFFHADVAAAAQDLTDLYVREGRPVEEEDSQDRLSRMHALAELYQERQDYQQVTRLLEACLCGRQKALGPDHPDTLASALWLARTYNEQGPEAKAIAVYSGSLTALQSARGGCVDADSAAFMWSLACIYDHRDRHADSLPLHSQCLEWRRGSLGEDHPETFASLTRLADCYIGLGRSAEALQLLLPCMEQRRGALGLGTAADPPPTPGGDESGGEAAQKTITLDDDTRSVMSGLSRLYLSGGPIADADTGRLDAILDLAALFKGTDRAYDAEYLLERCLDWRLRVQGLGHRDTLLAIHELADRYREGGNPVDAMALYEKGLESHRRVHGSLHPDTLCAIDNIVGYLDGLENSSTSYRYRFSLSIVPLLEECLASRRRLLGGDHEDTISTADTLDRQYYYKDKMHKTVPLREAALRRERRTKGDDHPDTLHALYRLADGCDVVGSHRRAETLWRECLERGRRVLKTRVVAASNNNNNGDTKALLALTDVQLVDLDGLVDTCERSLKFAGQRVHKLPFSRSVLLLLAALLALALVGLHLWRPSLLSQQEPLGHRARQMLPVGVIEYVEHIFF